jgi:cytochrome c5
MRHYTPGPVRASFASLVLAALAARPAVAGETVGPETCKACHPSAYQAWSTGPHARAQESLGERHRADARCLACHAPQRDEGLTGVTCEACHGPGRLYAARYVMRDAELARAVGLSDPTERTCLACHTDSTPSLERFEHRRKLLLIRHGKEPALPPPPPPPRPPRR